MSLLELENVTASYGSSQALFGVDLTLEEGEVLAVMGRNGMGKTTTVKCICRMLTAQGKITFCGQDLRQLPSFRAARLGIGLVPEGRRCFQSLSVEENLIAAARPGAWDLKAVFDLFPRLGERTSQQAGSLSGGEQQMLAIGRAMMTNPVLLVLDEATEGLAPVVRQEIWDAVSRLKNESGMSILLIDKSLKELTRICDRATILQRGKTVWTGRMDELDHETTTRYLGI